jgi:hypothetical protein
MQTLEDIAAGLGAEADRILEATGLLAMLEDRFGAAALTGSARYGLMVWRDLDIHMPVEPERRLEFAGLLPEIGRRLEAAGLRLRQAQFLDDYVDPHALGAGFYWGTEFRDSSRRPWKADLWGWAPDDFARRQAQDRELIAQLARADRHLILSLKSEARARDGYYGAVVGSMDIYRFVLAQAGTTLAELETWKLTYREY